MVYILFKLYLVLTNFYVIIKWDKNFTLTLLNFIFRYNILIGDKIYE